MGVLRRRDEARADGAPPGGFVGDELAASLPCLWEHLSEGRYPDGSNRKLSTLTLFCDAGVVKVCLNDRDQGLTAFASGPGLQGALVALEMGLAKDSLDWRKPQAPGKRK